MKKIILSLVSLAFSGSALMAQITNSVASGNIPTASDMGYTFAFGGSSTDNCPADKIPAFAGVVGNTYTVNTTTHALDITLTNARHPYSSQKIAFYKDNCSATTIDISTTSLQKIKFDITSDSIIPEIVIFLFDNTGANSVALVYPTDVSGATAVGVGTTTVTIPAGLIDFTGMDASLTNGISFIFRKTYLDATNVPAVTLDNVKIGDAVIITGTTAAVDNSLISVYPNPAKDLISIDLSALNGANATVKIMNSNGMLVYQGTASNSNEMINTSSFNRGIYMVQVASGDKVSNKKIVIE